MVSSLAAQLSQNVSLNSSLLLEKSRRKPGESYLFTGRDADQHDLESVHALGVNGFLQLVSLNSALRVYEKHLFSGSVKDVDRTLLTKEEDMQLDEQIAGFLRAIGPYLLDGAAGKVIEWLVRRYRINEFNLEDVLALFLPYHESPHFAKMVTILHIKENSTWSFLLAYKSAAQSIQRVALVTEMLNNSVVARFVAQLAPTAIKRGDCHRALLAFNAACLHEFISMSNFLDEGSAVYLLNALLEPLKWQSSVVSKDAMLGSYILLCAFSQKCHIEPVTLQSIISVMASCAHMIATTQFVNAAIAVCEPQDEVENFSMATLDSILKLPKIQAELKAASVYVGIEKLVVPLLRTSFQRLDEEYISNFFQSIITAPKIPQSMVQQLLTQLVEHVLDLPEDSSLCIPTRRILSRLHQQYGEMLDSVAQQISQVENRVEKVESLMLSLSLSSTSQSNLTPSEQIGDMIVSSSSVDATVRVAAVKNLLNRLASKDIGNDTDIKAMQDTLFSRIQDTNQQVLDLLFTSNPKILTAVLRMHCQVYVDYLKGALHSTAAKPKRSFIRTHISFLLSHFCHSDNSYATLNDTIVDQIFHGVILPFLLFTKSRQKIAEAVWDIVAENHRSDVANKAVWHPWLLGCVDIWQQERENLQKENDSGAWMAQINSTLASKIADNVMMSNDSKDHFSALIHHLRCVDNAYGRSFGYLIGRILLSKLSGQHQITAAEEIMASMGLDKFLSMKASPDEGSESTNAADSNALCKLVVSKPSNRSTVQVLQSSIVSYISCIPRPADVNLDWFCRDDDTSRSSHYVKLMRRVYQLAISSHLRSTLAGHLFSSLKDDALAFLSGYWVSLSAATSDTQKEPSFVYLALQHAKAFLQAHLLHGANGEKVMDFQTILPSLIIAFQSFSNRDTREAVLDCLRLLKQLAEMKLITVYAMDGLYGDLSESMQFLDKDDYTKYLTTLIKHEEHLRYDGRYILTLHQEHLSRSKTDKRKQVDYKQHVLCYLLSHIRCLRLPSAQIVLLESMEGISDSVKAQVLLPIIQELVDASKQAEIETRYGNLLPRFVGLILASCDGTIGSDLNKDAEMWETYLTSMTRYMAIAGPSLPRDSIAYGLKNGLFAALSTDRKVRLCLTLLKIGKENTTAQTQCKALLSKLIQEVSLIVLLLSTLQPAAKDQVSPATKRTKLSEPTEDHLSELTLFAEVLANKPLPESFDLISRLLNTLNHVVQYTPQDSSDVSYIEQLLMTAIDNAAEKITEVPNSTPSVIRLEILVELIRVSDNPHTFHHALLLMANLTRLAPESVLHNVMPVFTFMGSTIFHRDDAYSFNVVQKTIDNIVPVMVSSLQRTHQDRLQLYIGSRAFLRIFTDAVNHIPRHRRTHFFTHLVDVLGPRDFLTPVCLLLVEKMANKIVRQTSEEVKASLALLVSLVSHYTSPMRLACITEILEECRRITAHLLEPRSATPLFSEPLPNEEHSPPAIIVLKRRAQAFLIFVGYTFNIPVGESFPGHGISDIVSHLTHLATASRVAQQMDDIRSAAGQTLAHAMEHMTVTDFIATVLAMLDSGDQKLQQGSLDLLAERLVNVSDVGRETISPTISKVIHCIRSIILSSTDENIKGSAFNALASIGESSNADEASSLVSLLPIIITAIQGRKLAQPAMMALQPLSSKLGPRLIAHFRDIITECITLLTNGPNVAVEPSWTVLNNLLCTIPSFWGSAELTKVIDVCLNAASLSCGKSPSTLTLTRSIAKRSPAKSLLPTLCEMWPSVDAAARQGKEDRAVGYFDLLKRSIRNADRAVISEHLRPLFKLFLGAFEVTATLSECQTKAISAFVELVVKLNDTTFKPLFRRLFDWAFADAIDDSIPRKVTFCNIFNALLEFFKGLIIPYMSFFFQPFLNLLKGFSTSTIGDQQMWLKVITVASKGINYDDTSTFWRDDKIRQLSICLVQQIPVCARLFSTTEGTPARALLIDSINGLAESTTDDALLKNLNLDILLHTRSEEARIRVFALACSESLWNAHGGKLLGLASEAATFIAECAEDDNDDVLQASVRLKNAVESVAGALNGL